MKQDDALNQWPALSSQNAFPAAKSGHRESIEEEVGTIGRRERIRTSGPHVPNVVLYQAELLSEFDGRRPYIERLSQPQYAVSA